MLEKSVGMAVIYFKLISQLNTIVLSILYSMKPPSTKNKHYLPHTRLQRTYDILSGALILGTTWISKACARQRAGRAGRTRPGICLRLYTSEQHQLFQEFHIPEMLRIPLQVSVLGKDSRTVSTFD